MIKKEKLKIGKKIKKFFAKHLHKFGKWIDTIPQRQEMRKIAKQTKSEDVVIPKERELPNIRLDLSKLSLAGCNALCDGVATRQKVKLAKFPDKDRKANYVDLPHTWASRDGKNTGVLTIKSRKERSKDELVFSGGSKWFYEN